MNRGSLSVGPNPATEATVIRYTVTRSSAVRLSLYDISGCPVRELVNAWQPGGTYTVTLDVSSLARGIYFSRIQSGDYSETRKIVVTK